MFKRVVGKNGFSVTAYQGDAKTLLAFNLPDRESATNLAGFTIQAQPQGQQPYFLHNTLQFKTPGAHTQNAQEPPNSSINAPFHKFRWLHVPGSVHQGTKPFFGPYTYTVTPRFFDAHQSMLPIDLSRSVAIDIAVQPFQKLGLQLGFARGFTQSQAFVHHFGLHALFRPKTKDLLFDTGQASGTNSAGQSYTFKDEYEWLGFTARTRIFDILNTVLKDKTLHLDVFAYDLNEPDVMSALLELAKEQRVRIILDNATLHHDKDQPKPEDQFEEAFHKAAKNSKQAVLVRGHFGRFAHDKVLIVRNDKGAIQVLTGSTNFSITGIYVNSNHVLVFNDPAVAGKYLEVFEEALKDNVAESFRNAALAQKPFSVHSQQTPQTEITFSPHTAAVAGPLLQTIADRVAAEEKKENGSVLFAVMELKTGTGPVLPALQKLHADQTIFSYGISDNPNGIFLYTPGKATGVLVTGKPTHTKLPQPFDQVPGVGLGHQVHHKFIVCNFNGPDAVVYCGSSNLALGGEENNGDNLIVIHDSDVATVFALEALGLVDHFDFLDRVSTPAPAKDTAPARVPASKTQAAVSAGFFLSTTDGWVRPYFEPEDLHCVDRELFGGTSAQGAKA